MRARGPRVTDPAAGPGRLPAVRRARGYRLYGQDGRRYLDLWQQGGRAVLGHRAGRVTTVLKNVISSGLVADLPSLYTRRLERTLSTFFPAYPAFRIADSLGAGLELASRFLGRAVGVADVRDPLGGHAAVGGEAAAGGTPPAAPALGLWRPLCPFSLSPRVLLPRLPFAMAGAPIAVGFAGELPDGFPPSQDLSPVVVAGSLRALHDLARYTSPEWLRDGLLDGAPGWEQRGLYVLPRFPQDRYAAVFAAFLGEGVLLSPAYREPSILPSEASAGELEKMIGLFRRFPGE